MCRGIDGLLYNGQSWNHRWIREHDSSIPSRRTIHRRSDLGGEGEETLFIYLFIFFSHTHVYFLRLKITRIRRLVEEKRRRRKKERKRKRIKDGRAMSRCHNARILARLGWLFAQKWRDVGRYESHVTLAPASIGQLSNMHTMLRIPYVHPRAKLQCRVISGKTLRPCATLIYHFEAGERKRNVVVPSFRRADFSFSCLLSILIDHLAALIAVPEIYRRVSTSGEKDRGENKFYYPNYANNFAETFDRSIRTVVERIRE